MRTGVTYDPGADALYIVLKPSADFHRSVSADPTESVILDIDMDGEVMGIEILSPPAEVVERFNL